MPGWIAKVQWEIVIFSNTPFPSQLGKVRSEIDDLLYTPGPPQMASWVGRTVAVAWDISTLENARSYFETDDLPSFKKQQVQFLILFLFYLGITRKIMLILLAPGMREEVPFLLIGFPQSVQRYCVA